MRTKLSSSSLRSVSDSKLELLEESVPSPSFGSVKGELR